MDERDYIITAAVAQDGGEDSAAEARIRHKAAFPGRSARRMTHLGMLVGLCLRDMEVPSDLPVVYASAFAESCSLEAFIDSFPQASPMLFQTSIHPSALEQALIARRNAVGRFYPITSERNLAGQALETAVAVAEDGVLLVGGEERGSWLCEHKLASEKSFAFALRLARTGEGIGRIRYIPTIASAEHSPRELESLYEAIATRASGRFHAFGLQGWLQLEWQ